MPSHTRVTPPVVFARRALESNSSLRGHILALICPLLLAIGAALLYYSPAAAQTDDFIGVDTYAVPITIGGTTHVITVTVSAGSILELDATSPNLVVGSPIRLSAGVAQAGTEVLRTSTLTILPSVRSTANLRSGPSTNQTVVGSVRAGDPLEIIGISPDGQWYALASGAWIATSLVQNAPTRGTLTVITAPPTAIQPSAAQPAQTTATRSVTVPTPTPQPAPTANSGSGSLVIVSLDKSAEFAVIRNVSTSPVTLDGWILRSERGMQDCALRGMLEAGATLVISAMGQQAGFNCGFDGNIWNNSERDPAVLIAPGGVEVDRLE